MCLALTTSFSCGHVFRRGRDSCLHHLNGVQRGLLGADDPCWLGGGQVHCYERPDPCYHCLSGFTKAKSPEGVPEPARPDRAVYVPGLDDEKWIDQFRGHGIAADDGKRMESMASAPVPAPRRSAYRAGTASRISFRDRIRP